MSGNPENPIVQGEPLPKPSLPNPNQLVRHCRGAAAGAQLPVSGTPASQPASRACLRGQGGELERA